MNRILHRALLSLLTCSCLTGTLATAAESPRSGQLLFGWASQS